MKNPLKNDETPIHVLWLPTIFMAGVAYVVSMIDLIPGLSPISFLDDIIVIIAMIWFFTTWLPKNHHRIYWFKPKAQGGASHQAGGTNGQAKGGKGAEFDPFEVLKVRRGASPEEVKAAYREIISKYHPDKVAHLGEEYQQMAHEKVIDIQKAYEALCGKE
ncbi:MAG: DnaJ domain-containing protein [Candidatus Abyssubacteria bacterium]|nr:DnaJ domain-containing protein [Candidatus Abyssubacteria bacterium]